MNNTRPFVPGEAPERSVLPTKTLTDSDHFKLQLQQIINKLDLIFGSDITYARLSHASEISLDSSRNVNKITGSSDEIIKELQLLFSILSPEIANTHIRYVPLAVGHPPETLSPVVKKGTTEKIYI